MAHHVLHGTLALMTHPRTPVPTTRRFDRHERIAIVAFRADSRRQHQGRDELSG
jgi:hypothetical protein